MWPQYTYLAITILCFGFVIAKSGEPRGDYSIVESTINTCVALWLLYEGGFFRGMMP